MRVVFSTPLKPKFGLAPLKIPGVEVGIPVLMKRGKGKPFIFNWDLPPADENALGNVFSGMHWSPADVAWPSLEEEQAQREKEEKDHEEEEQAQREHEEEEQREKACEKREERQEKKRKRENYLK